MWPRNDARELRWNVMLDWTCSLKLTSICVVNQTGSIVQEGVVDSDPEAIAAFVRSKAPGTARIGLETGPTSTWLWTELKRLGLPVICIDARHAKAVLKDVQIQQERPQRCGRHRSHHADRLVQGGVRVKDLDSHAIKALLVSRALLVKIKRDLEKIRSVAFLKNLGLSHSAVARRSTSSPREPRT